MTRPMLIVITGPTASGKTSLSIDVARRLGCEIISADSRQLFADLPIGTAAPTPAELAAVPHHFIGSLALTDYYSAAQFETDALGLLPDIFERSGGYAVVCGGSMMYVDALVNGIDNMPTISPEVRTKVARLAEEQGREGLLALLEITDPDYYAEVDRQNTKRIVHALEISMQAGVPYSTLRTGTKAERPFDIIKFAIDMPRQELFERINRRVDLMIADGFVDEAKSVYHLRHVNSLNTVGYKELFAYFDGTMDFDTAVARIKKNTRVYAKKQMTWLKRDPSVIWLKSPATAEDVLSHTANYRADYTKD
ncbi:MAG: tRNA (adenosine(37)-N6)-dimethylallyltransferase MiaA [Muribaculaceae bacterium]|nr:tRNA (adenosine(37)-N6)-dimethylallyltransferase MiaA [Muribaculaceae bacterium]